MMRASVLQSPGRLVVEERPVPRPGPGEVLVEVGSVGVCGSDVHYFEHGRIGPYVVEQPLVLGHEVGGRVAAVGPGVPESRVGERVSLEPGVPCRRCRECRLGRYNLCREMRFFATPPVDGALCEYVTIAADFAYAVPDSMSDDAAALVEPLSVAVWAARRAGIAAGSRVLVTGAGPVGLLVTQVARALGATEVVVSDPDAHRRGAAAGLGATDLVQPDSDLTGMDVDVLVECSGAARALSGGLAAVGPAGVVVLVGMGSDEVVLPTALVQGREVTVTGTFRYANTWPAAVALAARGEVDLDTLVTGHVDLDHVQDAMRPDPADHHVKLVVRPAGL